VLFSLFFSVPVTRLAALTARSFLLGSIQQAFLVVEHTPVLGYVAVSVHVQYHHLTVPLGKKAEVSQVPTTQKAQLFATYPATVTGLVKNCLKELVKRDPL
jgi:hypothetical protein